MTLTLPFTLTQRVDSLNMSGLQGRHPVTSPVRGLSARLHVFNASVPGCVPAAPRNDVVCAGNNVVANLQLPSTRQHVVAPVPSGNRHAAEQKLKLTGVETYPSTSMMMPAVNGVTKEEEHDVETSAPKHHTHDENGDLNFGWLQ